ncbi:hypothetical protein YPPY89_2393, partial [Yersinia pestis PY-89]
MLALGVIGGG